MLFFNLSTIAMARCTSSPFLLALLLVAHLLFCGPLFSVASANYASGAGGESASTENGDAAELTQIPGQDTEATLEESGFKQAPGVQTVYYFPDKSVVAGEEAEILAGVSNQGELPLKVRAISAIVLAIRDQIQHGIQRLPILEFTDSVVPPSVQASFAYKFTVNKNLRPGSYVLIASISYEVEGEQYQSMFYNGEIEVLEGKMDLVRGETIVLVVFVMGMMTLLYGKFSKSSHLHKTRPSKKVVTEMGTENSAEGNMAEWLQGTNFSQKSSRSVAQSSKSKKKK